MAAPYNNKEEEDELETDLFEDTADINPNMFSIRNPLPVPDAKYTTIKELHGTSPLYRCAPGRSRAASV